MHILSPLVLFFSFKCILAMLPCPLSRFALTLRTIKKSACCLEARDMGAIIDYGLPLH